MARMATNNDIIELLRDVSAKQDKMVERIGDLEKSAALDEANVRHTLLGIAERVDWLEQTINDDIKPQTDDLKRMKAVGVGFLAVVGMGGVTLGGMLVWAGDTMAQIVRNWLRIT